MVIQFVVTVHLLLTFAEPANSSSLTATGTHQAVLIIEGICLLVEIIDVLIMVILKYRWNAYNPLLSKNMFKQDVVTSLLVTCVLLDWLASMTFRVRFEYVLPLRPILLVFMLPGIRRASHMMYKTMKGARDMFLLFICLCIIGILITGSPSHHFFVITIVVFVRME
jgi:hypothetical protein